MSLLNLRNISKSFGTGSQKSEVLKQINLSIDEGEFVAIVGFSGSGERTLINTIAGLIFPDSGEALVRDEKIRGPGPERGMVFQSYSLMPWLSVYDNVALAVNQVHRSWSKAQRDAHIRKYIALVNLTAATENGPPSCPAACASGSPWRGHWPPAPTSCCSTSRCRRSMP